MKTATNLPIEEVRAFNESVVKEIQEQRVKNAKVLDDLFLAASTSHKENVHKVQ